MPTYPRWNIRYTTDDASDTTPSWTTVDNLLIRSVSTSRGRDNERGQVDAGTAELVITNRNRDFDPTLHATIRPMNRWYIRAEMSAGVYEDVLLGYAESYQQQWPATGKDAVVVVSIVDEMKVLALDRLPTLDPPSATSYEDVVKFDEPQGYWRFQETANVDDRIFAPAVGGVSMTFDTNVSRQVSPIIGDSTVDVILGTRYGARATTQRFFTIEGTDFSVTPALPVSGPGDAAGLSSFTVETWFKSTEATPAAFRAVVAGPLSGGLFQYDITHRTTGQLQGVARNSGGTAFTTTSSFGLLANTWYHVALVVDGTNTLLYLNGALNATASWSGTFGTMDASGFFQLGTTTAVGGTRYFDEVAVYRSALSADRILAHYTAGVSRGFGVERIRDRAATVLAASTSNAAGSFASNLVEMTPKFMHGQSPLEELRICEETGQGFLFVAKDGTVTLLTAFYQSTSPYNTVQATFDDDGTDLQYLDVDVDYSESFLYNEVTAATVGGTQYTETDATSVSRYMKRTLTLPAIESTQEGDALPIAQNLLSIYKDPMTRITSLTLTTAHTGIAAAVLPLDLGDLIRVLRTPPGGGTRIDQQVNIQRIQVNSSTQSPYWTIVLGVSPL